MVTKQVYGMEKSHFNSNLHDCEFRIKEKIVDLLHASLHY